MLLSRQYPIKKCKLGNPINEHDGTSTTYVLIIIIGMEVPCQDVLFARPVAGEQRRENERPFWLGGAPRPGRPK
jgi:hypothetical protein